MTSFLLAVESADRANEQYKLRNLGLSHVGPILLLVQRSPVVDQIWKLSTQVTNKMLLTS